MRMTGCLLKDIMRVNCLVSLGREMIRCLDSLMNSRVVIWVTFPVVSWVCENLHRTHLITECWNGGEKSQTEETGVWVLAMAMSKSVIGAKLH